MGPRPAQSTDRKDTPPEASATAALRYAGFGFLLGFLLCAVLAGALVWLLRRPDAAPDRAASAANAGPYGDAGSDCYARSAGRFRERRRA